jgi:chemotaxis protein MotB
MPTRDLLTVSPPARSRGLAARAGLLVLLASTGMLAVGCASGGGEEMEALRLENEELRLARDELAAALDACDARFETVSAERDRLIDENESLRARMAAAPARSDTFAGAQAFEGSGAQVYTRPGELVVEMAGDVLFSSGKVTLRDAAKRDLDQVARVIQQRYPNNTIRIAGHTDSDPIRKSGWKTNERLGAERALAVEEYLASKGIDKDRMYVASFGPAVPRSSKADSRRVEIIILAPGSS